MFIFVLIITIITIGALDIGLIDAIDEVTDKYFL